MNAPLFEVVTPATSAAARRLTTAANVRTMIGSPTGDDTKLDSIIDRVSARAARHCGLALDVVGALPTFGSETVRATWFADAKSRRGHQLILPWRVPVTAITSIVEDGVTLTTATDYRLKGGAMVERLSSDASINWSCGKIVVVYVAGWTLPAGVPPDLEAEVIEQVKADYLGAPRDPGLKSITVPDVIQKDYGSAGVLQGLLPGLESALGPYMDRSL